jgi:hypothetical protein
VQLGTVAGFFEKPIPSVTRRLIVSQVRLAWKIIAHYNLYSGCNGKDAAGEEWRSGDSQLRRLTGKMN